MNQILSTLILFLIGGGMVLIITQKRLIATKLLISIGKIILASEVFAVIGLLIVFYNNGQNQPYYLSEYIRFDTLSLAMFLMVSFIGYIVLKFSQAYLHGDPNYNTFIKKLFLTISLVQLLMLSGNLFYLLGFWIATSLSLQRLILFYKDRKGARDAVKKKNVVARISDFFLLLAVLLLFLEFNTANLETLFVELKTLAFGQLSLNLELSALFIGLAAIIKSVQIPFHGWVLEVMEAPTPVSGLLHAGLLNAGPFLIIRFAYLIELSRFTPALLLIIGGISAIYGTLVFPSQTSIKKSLAYSSIGHMGFSLMLCGLGIYSAALLHLIAHSFYKAHSFLSAGSVIDKYRLKLLDGDKAESLSNVRLISGGLITVAIFIGLTFLMRQMEVERFQIVILTALIITGFSSFIIKSATIKNGFGNILKSVLAFGIVIISFFIFESLFHELFQGVIPASTEPGLIIKSISIALVLFFGIVVYLSLSEDSSAVSKWQVYRRNGFYIHMMFDRFLNSLLRDKILTK